MKKLLITFLFLCFVNTANAQVISNEKIDKTKVDTAVKIITELQNEMLSFTKNGSGPFVAAIYDGNGKLIAKTANSVVNKYCSNNHAEMNVIKEAEKD